MRTGNNYSGARYLYSARKRPPQQPPQAKDVQCPLCGAEPGEMCHNTARPAHKYLYPHDERKAAAHGL